MRHGFCHVLRIDTALQQATLTIYSFELRDARVVLFRTLLCPLALPDTRAAQHGIGIGRRDGGCEKRDKPSVSRENLMTYARSRWCGLLVAGFVGLGLVLLLAIAVNATNHGADPEPSNLDIILLIDNSWGMSNVEPSNGKPPSDPEGLRVRRAKPIRGGQGAPGKC